MPPRGQRLACTLRSQDGCMGTFDVTVGEKEGSVSNVEPVRWNKEPQKPVQEGALLRDQQQHRQQQRAEQPTQ